jgi:hypothetical protein
MPSPSELQELLKEKNQVRSKVVENLKNMMIRQMRQRK